MDIKDNSIKVKNSQKDHNNDKKENLSLNTTSNSITGTINISRSDEPKCRICYYNSQKEKLISPCQCKGSIGLIHRTCLQKWLETRDTNSCELCKGEYAATRTSKTFYDWYRNSTTQQQVRNILKDLFVSFLLTPLFFICIFIFIEQAIQYTKSKKDVSSLVSATVLAIFLLFVYLLYVIGSFRYHYKNYRTWMNNNWIVTLSEDAEEGTISDAGNSSSNLSSDNFPIQILITPTAERGMKFYQVRVHRDNGESNHFKVYEV
ncbi:E3 ubiquitin-protein ligase MARCH3-like isoform X1 [Centruroides sculpturatus]|uniref:E3 ubiquitin-protein ligase MARCH3-like isoform X1 n=2 Tax=Centruroides sculpturatus TaxID=218467 RepID=UPI000C6D3A76|nr:E3 ubiquitin-protein ligase MARCH3-like isoform X1 [Centruroides sculpturatus]